MKSISIIVLFSIVFSIEKQADIGFLYGVLSRLNSNTEPHVLEDSAIINTGDEIKINAGYKKETHFYVIFKDSKGEFTLFYSVNDQNNEDLSAQPDTIYAPVLPWSKFSDPPGDETFFLINSTLALNNLENLFKRYNRVKEKGRKKLAKQIQNEIDSLDPEKKQDLASISSRLDKPVVGGVTFRGEDEDNLTDISLTNSCTGISGLAFKKILLNHK